MSFVALLIAATAAALLVIATIAFLKAKDVFIMTHILIVVDCYIIPLLLIGIEIEKFSWISFAKITGLILLNIVVTNLICYSTIRRASLNKILPDAEIKNL